MSTVVGILLGDNDPTRLGGTVPELLSAPLRDIPQVAASAREDWLWIVKDGVVSDAATLPELMAHMDRSALVSLPVNGTGQPRDRLIGALTDDVPAMLNSIARHRLPLRFSPILSMLVPRGAVLQTPGPDIGRFGAYADLEWTARLFERIGGELVPTSRVVVPSSRHPLDLRAAARLVRSPQLRRPDALRQVRLAFRHRRPALDG